MSIESAETYGNRHRTYSPYRQPLQPQPQQPQPQPQQHAYYNLQMYQPPSEVSYHYPGNNPVSTSTAGSGGKVVVNGVMFTNPFTGGQTTVTPPPSSTTSSPSQHIHQPWHSQQTPHAPLTQSNAAAASVIQPLYAFFGRDPVFVTCPYCHHTDETRTELAIGTASILRCLFIPLFGLLFTATRDTRHYCRNCLNVIATHQP